MLLCDVAPAHPAANAHACPHRPQALRPVRHHCTAPTSAPWPRAAQCTRAPASAAAQVVALYHLERPCARALCQRPPAHQSSPMLLTSLHLRQALLVVTLVPSRAMTPTPCVPTPTPHRPITSPSAPACPGASCPILAPRPFRAHALRLPTQSHPCRQLLGTARRPEPQRPPLLLLFGYKEP